MSPEPPVISNEACPACGAFAGHKAAIKLRQSFCIGALLAGGILGLVLFNAGRAERVQCNACGAIFNTRSTGSKISLIIFWIVAAPTILLLCGYLIYELWTALTSS